MRTCKVCGANKSIEDYQYCYTNSKNVKVYARTCLSCTRAKCYVKDRLRNNCTVRGKAAQLIKDTRKRTKRKCLDFDLDLDFVVSKLIMGKCEATGIPFDYSLPPNKYKSNKYSPSLDRVDNSKGYTKDNVRVVVWWYNLMKNDETDEALLEFCKAVVNSKSK